MTKNGKNIHPDFTEELQKEGENGVFTYEEVKEGIDIGLGINDANYAEGLRDIKKVDADGVLNRGNNEELRKEFSNSKFGEEAIN